MSIDTPDRAAGPRSDDEQAILRLTEDWLAAIRAKDIPGLSGEELQVVGDWAFAWGTEEFTLVPQAGAPIEMRGKGMSILKRQADGSWKFARGINNTLPKPAASAR